MADSQKLLNEVDIASGNEGNVKSCEASLRSELCELLKGVRCKITSESLVLCSVFEWFLCWKSPKLFSSGGRVTEVLFYLFQIIL